VRSLAAIRDLGGADDDAWLLGWCAVHFHRTANQRQMIGTSSGTASAPEEALS